MQTDNAMDEDLQLLDRAIAGDRDAFDDLVRKYQRPLYSMLCRMVSDHEEASDMLQRSFIRAFTGMASFERRSSFKTWLYQIAINLAKNHYRDKARFTKVSLDDVVISRKPRTVETLIREQARARLREAFASLPEKQRITVMLRVQEQRPYEEIAQIMQCTVGTAKANYHHGVQKLKAKLGDHFDDSEPAAPADEGNTPPERTT